MPIEPTIPAPLEPRQRRARGLRRRTGVRAGYMSNGGFDHPEGVVGGFDTHGGDTGTVG